MELEAELVNAESSELPESLEPPESSETPVSPGVMFTHNETVDHIGYYFNTKLQDTTGMEICLVNVYLSSVTNLVKALNSNDDWNSK